MTHRIISSQYPSRIASHIRACGCICRTETTAYRGPLAIIGEGRVWAVAELIEVKPVSSRAKEDADKLPAYLWCFEGLREVEFISCANYAAPAMFQNGKEWEPMFLQAGAQVALNALLSPQDAPEQPLLASGVSVPTEPPLVGIPSISRGKTGQLEMF